MDIALSQVEIRPESSDTCRLEVHLALEEGTSVEPLRPGTPVTVTLHDRLLYVQVGQSPANSRWWNVEQVTLVPVWGSHAVLRDGVPAADLRAPLTITARVDRLDLRLA